MPPYASLDPRQTVASILAEPLAIHNIGEPRERKLHAMALLEAVGLNPRHPYSKALLSAIPEPNPETEATRTRIVLTSDVPSPLNPPTGCPFHPRCAKYAATPDDRCTTQLPILDAATQASRHEYACHQERD